VLDVSDPLQPRSLTRAYTWQTDFPDGQSWRPEPGFRSEDILDAYWMRHSQS